MNEFMREISTIAPALLSFAAVAAGASALWSG
jgi:hypothetical protein